MRQMKPILRIGTALLMSCLMAGACSLAAFAEDTAVRTQVTVVPADYSGSGNTLTVHVAVNEIATDGVLTVAYDPSVLSIAVDNVTVTELAAMHSANVTQPGELKIGFLADETQDTGDIAVLSFNVLKADEKTTLTLTAEVYGENEELLGDKVTLYAVETPEDEIPDTGVGVPFALAAAAAVSLACVAVSRRKNKGGEVGE